MTRKSDKALATYRSKRKFDRTTEPRGRVSRGRCSRYVVQKHDATRLHYDFRLELDGVLKSWAVTKGPSLDPADKRLAVRTEDHPVSYADFEGTIPEDEYGGGTVMLWDEGTWEPEDDPREGLKKGKFSFRLKGKRLKGSWALVRMRPKKGDKRENWLLIKHDDSAADTGKEITTERTRSVHTNRKMKSIAEADERLGDDAEHDRPSGKSGNGKAPATRKRSRRPGFVKPELATLVDEVPSDGDWIFEMKYDGYRSLAAVSGDDVRIYTRNGLDWTDRYPAIADALAELDLDGVLLDGEIVVVDSNGRSDFSALQRALKGGGGALSYFVFDLLADDGKSIRGLTLEERKQRLKKRLGKQGRTGPVFYSDHLETGGEKMRDDLCSRGFEGIIAKRGDRPYRSGRGKDWVKVKCGCEQELVIIGWSPSDKDRPFSSLLLGVYEDGELRYAGRIGTGFSREELDEMAEALDKRERKTSPLGSTDNVPRATLRHARWVTPELVAQVEFEEFTRDGRLRHGRFLGLREDKKARDVVRETPDSTGSGHRKGRSGERRKKRK